MPPQQPHQNDYSFFLDPQQPPKRKLFNFNLGGGGGKNQLVTKIVIGVVALIIILLGFTVLSRVLSSGKRGQIKKLVTILQQQQELSRISQSGAAQQLQSQDERNFNESLLLSTQTNEVQLLGLLTSHGKKVKDDTLNGLKSPVTDQKLSDARAASNLDPVFLRIMKQHLQDYQKSLAAAANSTENQKEIGLLKQSFQDAQKLLKQAPGNTSGNGNSPGGNSPAGNGNSRGGAPAGGNSGDPSAGGGSSPGNGHASGSATQATPSN
jgi:uncharacterized membrane protein YgcG